MFRSEVVVLGSVMIGMTMIGNFVQAQSAVPGTTNGAYGSSSTANAIKAPSNAMNATDAPSRRMPQTTARMMPPGRPISIDSVLAGITLSEEQRIKIDQVRSVLHQRMDVVAHDANENLDQKQAMVQGLQHMELREVYLLLTPEQRLQVRKKIDSQRSPEDQPTAATRDSQPK